MQTSTHIMRRLFNGLRMLATDPEFRRQLFNGPLFPTPGEYRRRFRQTLRQWLIHHQNHSVSECHWMGVPMQKSPLDAWIFQEIIHDVRPDIILELGSYAGGSTLFLAHLLDVIGKGSVISVDIDRTAFRVEHERIIPITGDSSSPEVVAEVTELCDGQTVLVIHDADHRKQQVLDDLRHYSPLVSVGSYFIVEDGLHDFFALPRAGFMFEDGPLPTIDQFLKENPDFEVDMARERYLLTTNPRGYLKRVREI